MDLAKAGRVGPGPPVHLPRVRGRLVVPTVAGLILAGCGLLSPDYERVPSVLERLDVDLPFEFSAPDTVDAGVEFGVSLRTYGGGCREEGSVRLETTDATAVLIPEDVLYVGGDDCTLDLVFFRYDELLRFDAPGAATIRVRGVSRPSGDPVEKVVRVVVREP